MRKTAKQLQMFETVLDLFGGVDHQSLNKLEESVG